MNFSDTFRTGLAHLTTRQRFAFPANAVPGHFRSSAVLLAFWSDGDDILTAFIQRPRTMSRHAGQVALPGGLLEQGESWVEVALREAEEEVGIDPSTAQVIGLLDDAWTGAGNHIVPVVAWLEDAPNLTPNPAEVTEIFVPRVSDLMKTESRQEKVVTLKGKQYIDHILSWPGGRAIGPTADMMLEALDRANGQTPSRGEQRLRELLAYTGQGD